jgi:hypothetical protein
VERGEEGGNEGGEDEKELILERPWDKLTPTEQVRCAPLPLILPLFLPLILRTLVSHLASQSVLLNRLLLQSRVGE